MRQETPLYLLPYQQAVLDADSYLFASSYE